MFSSTQPYIHSGTVERRGRCSDELDQGAGVKICHQRRNILVVSSAKLPTRRQAIRLNTRADEQATSIGAKTKASHLDCFATARSTESASTRELVLVTDHLRGSDGRPGFRTMEVLKCYVRSVESHLEVLYPFLNAFVSGKDDRFTLCSRVVGEGEASQASSHL
ncbi:hypothetical protein EGR_05364 [Echinococcus granulosus]|uniref:Uncharacterized protein n=1 Tax=Echinococcus granulosus TaxID=6210 RepID=W6V1K2_ECHGR|nr:hypothetical protein EGR_05364 [Echinococcus granulosus]EUB59744.1 hypothetical protein EGR_05364 [Echinococcus granulosus]